MKFYKDLLSESELDFVNKSLAGDHWGFGYISTNHSQPIWNFDKQLGKPVAELIASKLDGYRLDDWHINGQTFGLTGSPHTDSYSGCTHAFVFFYQDWDYVWGGRLHILKETGPVVVTPQKNFGVLFDSKIVHYAEAPLVPLLRISIGLKLYDTSL